ncbi:L,D-transpeptidase family protein [Marinobacter fonticola]|uniref:L,D-transpeptidase family protein n=1 Tax=Marinobacter fonticola TaxID=2603215 RepID=UPI0011E7CFEF|nr:L,D-transpeptidase family protein [Marinobacter fonticola]
MEIRLYKNHTIRNVWRRALAVAVCFCLLPAAEALHRIDPDQCEPLPDNSSFHHAAMARFSTQSGSAELWADSQRLQALIDALDSLAADGLEPADYHTDALKHALAHFKTWGQLGKCDIRLANDAYLRALTDLRFGKTHKREEHAIWYAATLSRGEDPGGVVTLALNGLDNLAQALTDARPDLPRYRYLRRGFVQAQADFPQTWAQVPNGPTLEKGDRGDRVALLRERLAAEGYLTSPPAVRGQLGAPFDDDLELAVERFQRRHSLTVDGKVGARTIDELNISPQQRLEQIRANLERLRWLARDMERTLLLVDIAAARIHYYEDGDLIWSGRAQVGKPRRATPELKSVITHVTVNPHWNMPRSIFLRDALPSILRDPLYLSKRGIRVYDREGNELTQTEADWSNPHGLRLRQDPGPGNALGQVALRFSNPFAVYLHDTPAASLFESQNRFYSSGCVRVEDAMTLTRMLFRHASPDFKQHFETVRTSGESQNIHLPRGVYILMAYWTAEADASGQITYRPDVYGSDGQLLALLE